MNRDQVYYQLGLIKKRYSSVFSIIATPIIGGSYGAYLYSAEDSPLFMKIVLGGLGLFLISINAKNTYLFSASEYAFKEQNKKITKGDAPLEYVERVEIEDVKGLESLLFDTRASNGIMEWGTVIKSRAEGDTAIIEQILSRKEAEKKYIAKRGMIEILVEMEKVMGDGFNGVHHFHPFGQALNYNINPVDKFSPPNTLNLLTFNMPNRSKEPEEFNRKTRIGFHVPEIIAFNSRHVYIPENRGNKSKLVKAAPTDIMKYLGDAYY